MSILLLLIHIVVSIALILIVLLQTGKGADMGAAFGGGSSQALLGSTGTSTLLTKATTIAAIIFMVTSIGLAYMSGHKKESSIMLKAKSPIEKSIDTAAPDIKTDPVAESVPVIPNHESTKPVTSE